MQFFVAATRTDWLEAFHHVSGGEDLLFYEYGVHLSSAVPTYRLQDIPHLGEAMGATLVGEKGYIVLLSEQGLRTQPFHLSNGSIRYAVDQRANPDSFVFHPGGLYNDHCFLKTEISSLYDKGGAVDVAKRVRGYVRRHWHQGNGCRIGEECYRMFNTTHVFTQDCRLVTIDSRTEQPIK